MFCRRIFWHRWRKFVGERRKQHREEDVAKNSLDVRDEMSLDKAFTGAQCAKDGEGTNKREYDSCGDDNEREKMLAVIMLQKRHYFERWRLRHKGYIENLAVRVKKIVAVQSLYGIRRWKRIVRLKKDQSVLKHRAYSFLRYFLLKRSLNRLGRYALLRRQDRTLKIKIMASTRHRKLATVMQQWVLRQQLHRFLALWKRYMQRRRHQVLLYQQMTDVLTHKASKRLLHRAFTKWVTRYTLIQRHRMFCRIIDYQIYRKSCEKAWRRWRCNVRTLVQFDTFYHSYQERTLRRVWDAWSDKTREKRCQNQRWRQAVRYNYLSLLRLGFEAFCAWRAYRQLVYSQIETMLEASEKKLKLSGLNFWIQYTTEGKLQVHKYARALRHYELRLLRHTWSNGFRKYYSTILSNKTLSMAAQEHHNLSILRHTFCIWKDAWRVERTHHEMANKTMQKYLAAKDRIMKCRILESWLELTRATAARRVLKAQVRGQAQRRILDKHLSQWITYVSVSRWEHITRHRSGLHYRNMIMRKCLNRWHQNVCIRQSYRKKTGIALIHWKLHLQRTVFNAWKLYMRDKRLKQQRIHEALQFRHEHFIREGLRHWMVAALYLQEKREQRVATVQAANTLHIWRRVAAIAWHWRYLAIRDRDTRNKKQSFYNTRAMLRRSEDFILPSRARAKSSYLSPEQHKHEIFDNAEWTNERSPLSEFVLLPRNRPQPRKFAEQWRVSQSDDERFPLSNANTSLKEVSQCGFKFPVEPFASLSSEASKPSAQNKSPINITILHDRKQHEFSHWGMTTPTPHKDSGDRLLPISTQRQLDVLERQLLAISQRKKEWKAFQNQLEILRETAEANSPKLRAMEEEHMARRKQWLHTNEQIRSLVAEIQLLRNALLG